MKTLLKILVLPLILFFLTAIFWVRLPKTALAAGSCSLQATTVEAGKALIITEGGFAAGESVQIFPQGSFLGTELAKTADSTAALITQNIPIPASQAPGPYNFVIVTRFPITQTICSGGPFFVTPPGVGGSGCTYDFGPTTAGVNETIIASVKTGTAGDVFLASIVTTTGTVVTSASNKGAFPLNINLTGPSSAGSYIVAVRDDTTKQLCAGNSALTVTSGAGTYVVVVFKHGCSSLSCIVFPPPTVNGTNYTATGLTPSTQFDVIVCSPNCGSGNALPNFHPKICTSKSDGTLYIDWLVNSCSGDVVFGGGSFSCNGFFDCLKGVASPSNKFTDKGLIGQIISGILPIVLGLAGFLSVIIIIISGLQFITSNGNPEGAAAARGRLTFAIVGFAIIVLAFAITKIIDNIFLGGSGIL